MVTPSAEGGVVEVAQHRAVRGGLHGLVVVALQPVVVFLLVTRCTGFGADVAFVTFGQRGEGFGCRLATAAAAQKADEAAKAKADQARRRTERCRFTGER